VRPMQPGPLILLVEDDPSFRAHVRSIVEEAGYLVAEAKDGEEGLQKAREGPPALVILDIGLPGFSGYEVCRTLREEFGEMVGIIFVSGSKTEMLDRVAGLGLGADDYLVKPFEPEELIARVRAVLRRVLPATSAGGGAAFAPPSLVI
jgi:DNA-binding response OmpR family regulator